MSIGKELLLLLSRFSRVRFCATPQTAAHKAPLSLGFGKELDKVFGHMRSLLEVSNYICDPNPDTMLALEQVLR